MNTKAQSTTRIFTAIAAGAFVYLIRSGIYNNYGVFLPTIVEQTGMAFASVSFVLAVGQFIFGLAQPVAGILADRFGNRAALLTGVGMTLLGMLLLPFCKSPFTLSVTLSLLLSGGIGLLAFGVISNAVFRQVPARIQSTASGIVNAASGIGNTLFTPLISAFLAAGGLLAASGALGVCLVLTVPVVWLLTRRSSAAEAASVSLPPSTSTKSSSNSARSGLRAGIPEKAVTMAADPSQSGPESARTESAALPLSALLKQAFQVRDYCFIVAGFFTCGFHMCIITGHLFTEILSIGFARETATAAFSVYGIATLAGALLSGLLCGKFRMKNVLGSLYGIRVIAVLMFLLLPKSLPLIVIFISLLGLTGAATVTPVNGICGRLFGDQGRSVLFGIAFVAHQFGGFLSSWLGGVIFETFGGYGSLWIADICLCAFASLVSFLIGRGHSHAS